MKTVLSIAGSDSSSGAGIQQDLKVFSNFRLHGSSVITAITAQNTEGVRRVYAVPPDIVEEQMEVVMKDLKPVAVKTGMLFSPEIVRLVREKMQEYKIENLIVDPVMIASSGDSLMEKEDKFLIELRKLISRAKISTPNMEEAKRLAGIEADAEELAKKLGNCLITGGEGDAVDVLHYNGKFYRFSGRKINLRLHGAGCAFSAAITAGLAHSLSVVESVKMAKEFMEEVLSRNLSIGSGARIVDTAGIKMSKTLEGEKGTLLEKLEDSVRRFIQQKNSYLLAPEVGINIVMALPKAKRLDDVAGITGRIVRNREELVPVGVLDFNASSHIGRVVLTAMRFNPEIRAAMNIRFSEDILEACKKLDLSIGEFRRDEQPPDSKTMEWGTSKVIETLGRVPDLIYDRGGVGKEAMIRILGKNSEKVVEKAIKISEGI